MFSLSEDQNVHDYSIPPISEDQLRLWLQNSPNFSTISMEDDRAYDHFSNLQSENANSSENSNLEEINLHGFDSHTQQSSNNVQARKSHRGGGKEGFEASEECKRHKRARSTQVHNMNERLRRKKLTEKMATLQEMIPNSVKKDQASIIDDAIKYIKTLQDQIQMMLTEASHTVFHSPVAMLPQGLQGIPIPNLTPFLQRRSGGNGMCLGISIGYPMGLYNPWLFQSSVASPGLQSVQNNKEQSSEAMYANSISCFGFPLSTVASEEAWSSQGTIR